MVTAVLGYIFIIASASSCIGSIGMACGRGRSIDMERPRRRFFSLSSHFPAWGMAIGVFRLEDRTSFAFGRVLFESV